MCVYNVLNTSTYTLVHYEYVCTNISIKFLVEKLSNFYFSIILKNYISDLFVHIKYNRKKFLVKILLFFQ